ncbi:MAG: hypothetical protein P9L99_11490 [Candidatus Lernaella stagnicola]|nr:hypothetical protein [Candidatus Lernaella stagnicola]
MRQKAIMVMLVLLLGSVSVATAYGPSTHMREADHFLTLCELQPQAGVQYDADFLRRHRRDLLLGSIWPDIGRVLTDKAVLGKVDENSVDPHNRHFVTWLLNEALTDYPADEWRVAFAIGNHMHCAGDATAQDMLTQHMAVVWGLGEMDAITGTMDNHPGGENEAVLEGGLEFMEPAFSYYFELVDEFITSPGGLARLTQIVSYYLDRYAEYFSLEVDYEPDALVGLIVDAFSDYPHNFPPCSANAQPEVLRWARSGFDNAQWAGAKGIDWDELGRVINNGLLEKDTWDRYFTEGFFAFSPQMMLDYHEGQGWYDYFPNWSAKAMKSGSIQSLSRALPQVLVPEDGRFLLDMNWYENDSTTPITSIDAASPPATVTLSLVLFDSHGRFLDDDSLMIRVREDSLDQTEVALQLFDDVSVDPWTYDVNGPLQVEVDFDPSPAITNGATGLIVELIHGESSTGRPYFTTDWSVYEQIEGIDLTKDAYTLQYSTYGHWPYSLRINYDEGVTQ